MYNWVRFCGYKPKWLKEKKSMGDFLWFFWIFIEIFLIFNVARGWIIRRKSLDSKAKLEELPSSCEKKISSFLLAFSYMVEENRATVADKKQYNVYL